MAVDGLFCFQCIRRTRKHNHSRLFSGIATTIFIVIHTASTVGYLIRNNINRRSIVRHIIRQQCQLSLKKSSYKYIYRYSKNHLFLNRLRLVPALNSKNIIGDIEKVDPIGEDDDGETDNKSNEEQRRRVKRHKHWIMLVDDEEAIRLAVGRYLYESGYQVTACADSDAAIEVLSVACNIKNKHNKKQFQSKNNNKQQMVSKVPDVIVLDVRMPGSTLNGIELLQWIRSSDHDNWFQTIPVIMLTAKGLTQDRIVGYKAGATSYLTKPFNPLELLSIVDNSILRNEQMKYSTTTQVISGNENLNNNSISNITALTPTPIALMEMKNDIDSIKEMIQQLPQNRISTTDIFLTPAERDVLDYLGQGMTKQEIASARNVTSIQSVTRIMNNLYKKTNLSTRTGLIRWAIETGYLPRRS